MSWFVFREAAELKPRGIKVQGFPDMHRPRLNLSWGMNEKETRPNYDSHIMPSTIAQEERAEKQLQGEKQRPSNENIKVLTQTSDEEDELMKLVREQKAEKGEEEPRQYGSKNRSQSLNNVEYQFTNKPKSTTKDTEFAKRMRYLQNSLLPNCRRDTMDSILDHDLSRQVPLSQSRLSNRSNKKNESSVVLGVGYNAFCPPSQPKKELTQQLQEMYEYEERCRRRKAGNQFNIG